MLAFKPSLTSEVQMLSIPSHTSFSFWITGRSLCTSDHRFPYFLTKVWTCGVSSITFSPFSQSLLYLIFLPNPRLTRRMLPFLPFLVAIVFYTDKLPLGHHLSLRSRTSHSSGQATSAALLGLLRSSALALKTTNFPLNF